ncbi:protein-glutamate methylesterase/protein-glutamine glutaminase [Oceanibium sediminis]|uniref:protein-glutamate methylesterase/protein-glutamine glutaminase n=1 Tax=Oceanibium sediminis TaxID=2026339 RepID=UPI000DD2B8A1|nr:chemotaxis response regulator protein-glutamate methylesterase [Oceanibium sediminis]
MNHGRPSGHTRVIVVDDSRLMRRMIVAGLETDPDITVVAEAADTVEARRLIRELDPDVITLDVEMPGMNGIDFLKKIMELRPMPVVMVSTLTASGTDVTLSALEIGAVEAIAKPAGRDAVARFSQALREKVRLAHGSKVHPSGAAARKSVVPRARPAPMQRRPGPARRRRVDLIALGASTGGVNALTQVLEGLPAGTPPILVTQHMPALFAERFASRLNAILPHDVAIGGEEEILRPGQIRIAPGENHLALYRDGAVFRTRLDPSGPISGHKPSVDVLFNSVSTSVGGNALGVILTGMGRDGAAGLRAMRKAGAYCIGQNENSCVVYGMPRAARDLDAVDEELALGQIPLRICEILNPQGVSTLA